MNAAKMLAHCSPIVETIFKNLSALDLSSCAQVCKMWKNMSETEYKRRLFMELFLQLGHEEHYLEMFLPEGKYAFQERVVGARIKAETCICLMTLSVVDTLAEDTPPPPKRKRRGKYEKRRHQLAAVSDHFLKPCLPSRCQLFCMASSGIIGSQGHQTPVEVEFGAAITGILIPHFPGMEIHHVTIEQDTASEFPRVPIKCLLVFMGGFPEHIQPFVARCAATQREKFALGGAIVAAPTTGLGSCFAFTGENVEAASIVIDYSVQDIAAELKSFERTVLYGNQCFCFAFTCVEKGSRQYKTSNYESDLFHKTYPNVPLLGVFGYGEIGAYHVPDGDQKRAKRFGSSKCMRTHTTTFVLVSIKTEGGLK